MPAIAAPITNFLFIFAYMVGGMPLGRKCEHTI